MPRIFLTTLAAVAVLAQASCGGRGDWRLPNEVELQLLATDLATVGDAARSAFTGIQSRGYWNTFSTCLGVYGVVEMSTGQYSDEPETVPHDVWPLRK